MKRPPVLDPPRVTRRKRVLSSEEVQLWESVAKQARPLRKRPRAEKIAIEIVEETTVVVARSAPPPSRVPARPGEAQLRDSLPRDRRHRDGVFVERAGEVGIGAHDDVGARSHEHHRSGHHPGRAAGTGR